jgi:hypothetical protein
MKGLLFTPEMFRAVLMGRKTQTRRVVPGKLKQYEEGWSLNGKAPRTVPADWSPYQPGETVCMLTTWSVAKTYDEFAPCVVGDLITHGGGDRRLWLSGIAGKPEWAGKSRPGRFMPNSLRPLMPKVKIVDVDVQRVRQISEADAIAEGVAPQYRVESAIGSAIIESHVAPPVAGCVVTGLGELIKVTPLGRKPFRSLWNSINEKRGASWAQNPQVFVIKFSREVANG